MGLFDSFKSEPEETEDLGPVLTVKEACAYLKVSDETLRVWERQGKLKGYQLPSQNGKDKPGGTTSIRSKRYKLSEIKALIQPIEPKERHD